METVFYLVSSKLQAYKFSLDKLKENGNNWRWQNLMY